MWLHIDWYITTLSSRAHPHPSKSTAQQALVGSGRATMRVGGSAVKHRQVAQPGKHLSGVLKRKL